MNAAEKSPRHLVRRLQSKSLTVEVGKSESSIRLGSTTSLARGASDECDTAVALPLTAVSSQNVIGSFEARFFFAHRLPFGPPARSPAAPNRQSLTVECQQVVTAVRR